MKWLRKILLKLAGWFQPVYKLRYAEDIPERMETKTIYIVGIVDDPWLLTFQCPCGCKSPIQLNILKDARPRWKFEVWPDHKINITPSVWRTTGCRSHFFVRRSKIQWC